MRKRRDPLNDPALTGLRDALTAEPSPDELQGEHATMAAYGAIAWDRKRRWHRPAILATKLGAATVASVLAMSGVAAAAYTGSLPEALQDFAHKTIKAPKAHPPAHAVGPDASGTAAYGLCQAFAKDKEDEAKEQRKAAERAAEQAAEGGSPKAVPPGQAKKHDGAPSNGKSQADGERGQSKEKSVAYRNLVRAAGGEDKVDAFCAAVPKPSGSAEPKATGKPTAKPSHRSTGRPTAKPTHAATAKPSDVPAADATPSPGSPTPTSSASESPAP